MTLRVVAHLGGRALRRSWYPKSSTTTLSEIDMTIAMWCSTSSTVSVVLVAERADQLAELVDLGVRQPGGRFVEQQQLRSRRERPRDLDALQRAVRQSDGRPVGEMVERQALEDRSRFGSALCVRATVRVAADEHVVEHRQRREQREVLEGASDAEPGDAVRRHSQQILAVEHDTTAGRLVQAADAVEERGLAGAVRPDQRADLALLDREGEVGERDDSAELDPNIFDRQQRHSTTSRERRRVPRTSHSRRNTATRPNIGRVDR